MQRAKLFVLLIGIFCFCTEQQAQEVQHIKPSLSKGYYLGTTGPMRDIATVEPAANLYQGQSNQQWEKQNHFPRNYWVNDQAQPQNGDPALQKKYDGWNTETQSDQINTIVDIEGIREFVPPPDPTGDIGKDHYVMATNRNGGARVRIYDKTGTTITSFATSSLWSQVGRNSIGDPIIQYDHDAERWILLEMEGGNGMVIAISETSDPTGTWKAFYFATEGFPDYPKLNVWGDSYFITVNEIINNNLASGYALEKNALLNGNSNFGVLRFEMTKFGGVQYQPATGADWEGGPPPPPGSPGYIFRVYDDAWGSNGADHLESWKINVNWANPSQSVVSGPHVMFTQPFELRVCNGNGLFNCIEQPSGSRITALDQIIMYRVPYRNFGSYESVVLNHVVDADNNGGDGGRAGVRWYELRKTANTDWEIYQQGTYAPGTEEERFMGMISQDERGNIAAAYSVSSSSTYPSLRLTGRRGSDPLNIMTVDEHTIIDGGGSHTSQRWGDYCNMSVDPTDDRTFWFVGEYQPAGAFYGTRIYAFTVSKDTFDASPTQVVSPEASHLLGTNESISVRIKNLGIESASNLTATLRFEGQNIITEPVPGTISADDFIDFTFSQTVDMSQVGKFYNFEIITNWGADQFEKNDTLRTRVRKLTSNDAAVAGTVDFPGFVCSKEHNYGFLLKNQGQEPLTSARIRYRLNGVWDTVQWVGNLPACHIDTVPITLSPIKTGSNFLTHVTELPNGQADQDVSNDSTLVKFNGNIDGAWSTLEIKTTFGQLRWEIRENGQIVTSGTATADSETDLCLKNNTCYELSLSGRPFGWEGDFALYDLFGNALVQRMEVFDDADFVFCTPERLLRDVGAYKLLRPTSGGNLKNDEPVQLEVRNFGFTPHNNLQVHYRLDGGAWNTEALEGTLEPGEKQIHTFSSSEDLSTLGQTYNFEAYTTTGSDMNHSNDTISPMVTHRADNEIGLVDALAFQVCNDTSLSTFLLHVQNNGLFTITSFRLAHSINGGAMVEDNIIMTILPNQLVEVPIYLGGHSYGPNTIDFTITNVNNLGNDFNTNDNSASLTYSLDEAGFPLDLFWTLDDKPTETSWFLKHPNGDTVAMGGAYTEANDLFELSYCLDSGLCYQLDLFDAGGDGFEGKIIIESPRTGITWTFEDLIFESDTTLLLCLTDLCVGFSQDIQTVGVSQPGQTDGSVTIVPMGGTPPYAIFINDVLQTPNGAGTITGLGIGSYRIKVVDALGCTVEQNVAVTVFIDTEQLEKVQQLALSPNPTKDFVQVTLDALESDAPALGEVFFMNGQRVFRFPLMRWDDTLSGMFSLEKMPAGTYMVRVRTGDAVYVEKVVKK